MCRIKVSKKTFYEILKIASLVQGDLQRVLHVRKEEQPQEESEDMAISATAFGQYMDMFSNVDEPADDSLFSLSEKFRQTSNAASDARHAFTILLPYTQDQCFCLQN